jgi:diaminohydroxyphosphoribosylaminopyrimidine deaminase/5-amino-6-(5-phosphoribosylamino)uracil reductase
MKRAAALARRAEGQTTPNPPVGAIVVKDGIMRGAGFHHRAGEAHAEVIALAAAGSEAIGADLYVTLEPCAHYGRTPPCAGTIVDAGIRRVVAGMQDPNPLVNGKGFAFLTHAGIEVHSGVLASVCGRLIEPYVVAMAKGRPYVHLKLAMSADGRIAPATGPARWITGRAARRHAHRLRARMDAVLVGIGTVQADDPALTARLRKGHVAQPRPVVLDAEARTPPEARLLADSARTPIILCGENAPADRIRTLESAGARVVPVAERLPGLLNLSGALDALRREGIQSVLVEGGARVAAAFLAAGLVDRATLFLAPVFLGDEAVASVHNLGSVDLISAPRGRLTAARRLGSDAAIEMELGGR